MSQNDKILEWLKSGRVIEPLTAQRKFGCMRLGARIYELKRRGYNITTTIKEVHIRSGVARVAFYRLESA